MADRNVPTASWSAHDEPNQNFSVAAPSIQLPKGGGAIRGIGEKFAANPVTGTASMSIPIATSPGRAGFGPQLSLSYDSGAGNGPFGFGWSLSLPSITRKTAQGLPQYSDADESDVFILSGAEDLVPVLDATGQPAQSPASAANLNYRIKMYRPRIEGLFARIERWTLLARSADVHWRSISKDNILTVYGGDPESRIADPEDAGRIFSWLICETRDDKGNAVLFRYKAEDGRGVMFDRVSERNRGPQDDARRTANRYLKHIYYGNRSPLLNTAAHRPLFLDKAEIDTQIRNADWPFEVVFDYGEHQGGAPKPGDNRDWDFRADPFSTYRAGFEVRTTRLCQRVLMFHHFPGEAGVGRDCLVRSTDFRYLKEPSDAGDAIYAFVRAATHCGYRRNNGGYETRSLPPVEFTYSEPIVQDTVRDVDESSLQNLPVGVDGSAYQWTDLHGEGIPGILSEQGGAWFYKRNLSPISQRRVEFAPLECVAIRPNLSFARGQAQFMDLAGDGRPDLVRLDGPMPGLYEHDGDEGWGSFRAFTSRLNRDTRDPNLRLIDLDGDGHADVLVTEDDALVWHASLAEQGFGPATRVIHALDEEKGPRVVFADGTDCMYLADLSGDGLTDLVRIRNGEICYWPNRGYGRFGAKVTMDHAPQFDNPDQFDYKRLRLADIDGSGTTDIIYLHRDGVRLYFNQSGNGWSAVQELRVFPRIDDAVSIVPTDLLGNGTACLVWSSPLPGDARMRMRYVSLMGEQKPHLLVRTVNNLGAETHVEYAPSTKFYLADRVAGKPWITKLPFPVHCVEKITVKDNWRKTSFATKYSYHHGHFDAVEREFRGFGRVEQVDIETYGEFTAGNAASPYITDDKTLYQPPIKTITWYQTGASTDRRRILSAFEKEYFPIRENRLADPDLDETALSSEEWREALRACKGMALRQEVYELDVDAIERGEQKPVRLFSTAHHNCHIRRLQPAWGNRHAVFLVAESEAITYNYELDLRHSQATPDPRIAHTLNLHIDEFGNVLQSAAVVYPRIERHVDAELSQADRDLIDRVQREQHVTYTEAHYTDDVIDDPGNYRVPARCAALTYEITGILPGDSFYFALDELQRYHLSDRHQSAGLPVAEIPYHQLPVQTQPAPAEKRLVEHVRVLFFKDTLSGADPLPFRQQGRLALPFETYKLALSDALLNAVFQRRDAGGVVVDDKLAIEIEPGVTARTLLGQPGRSGYVAGSAIEPGLAGQFWIRSGTVGFENDAARHFYLPERYTDPFGNITTLEYDSRDLFQEASTDMLGNSTRILAFDYRVLSPSKLRDINDNETEACFDVLGMVVAVAVKGKGHEADDLNGFNGAMTDPALVERVNFFFKDATYNESECRRWLGSATARYVYYFGEIIAASGQTVWGRHPARACGILRETHVANLKPPVGLTPAQQTRMQVAFECSDGLGAVLMKKVQAEPAAGETDLRWIATGKTILNNKGKTVKQYEPYFSSNGHRCEEPLEQGVTPVMYYDAAGRLVRTELPDGTLSRVEFSPWHVKSFDANDIVEESRWYRERLTAAERGVPLHDGAASPQLVAEAEAAEALAALAGADDKRAARMAAHHSGTPALTILDSLGREVISIAHNRATDAAGIERSERYLTFTKLDAEGQPLWIRDARGNLVMQYIAPPVPNNQAADPATGFVPCYDMAGNLLFQHGMDAGDRWTLMDAAGKPMLAWDFSEWRDKNGVDQDVENRVYSTEYDALHRPTRQWLRVNSQPRTLVDYTEYGETLADAKQRNLRGQAHLHYDPSGANEVERLDFKRKPVAVSRTLTKNYDAPSPDWSVTDRDSLLETDTYAQVTEYDALGRMTTLYNWHRGVGGRVAVYVPTYNERGLLSSETLDVGATKQAVGHTASGKPLVNAIAEVRYDVKGQQESLRLGNQTVTRYTYDPQTFRLRRLYTRRDASFTDDCGGEPPPPRTAAPDTDSPPRSCGVQNLSYTYDPVGNITHVQDDAQQVIYFQNSKVEPSSDYVYDALYRLIEATGREDGAYTGAPTHVDRLRRGTIPDPDPNAMRRYTQRYVYDPVGNIAKMQHDTGGNGGWTLRYNYAIDSNRLTSTQQGALAPTEYSYDIHGNMLNLANVAESQYLRWDYRDMIHSVNLVGGGDVFYQYDAAKQRTRKHIENESGSGGHWERIYLGGYERYRRYSSANSITPVEEIETHHLVEGKQRVLLVDDVVTTDRTHADGRAFKTDSIVRYQYSNHLGSGCLELDGQAEIMSYEEYHPYGTTAYRAMKSGIEAPAKRYRYTGMERDEESGLNYQTARYYVTWLGRWASCDPKGLAAGVDLYTYVHNSPIGYRDPTGTSGEQIELVENQKISTVALRGEFAYYDVIGDFIASDVKSWGLEPGDYVRGHSKETPHYSSRAGTPQTISPQTAVANAEQSVLERAAARVIRAKNDALKAEGRLGPLQFLREERVDLSAPKNMKHDIVIPQDLRAQAKAFDPAAVDKVKADYLARNDSAIDALTKSPAPSVSSSPVQGELALGGAPPASAVSPTSLGVAERLEKAAGSAVSYLKEAVPPAAAKVKAAAVAAWDTANVAAKKAAPVLKFLGQVATYQGADTVTKDYIRRTGSADAAFAVFWEAVAAGAIDDATVLCPGRAPVVMDYWEQRGAGPAQTAVGDFNVWLSKW